jgi:hypothetical protein
MTSSTDTGTAYFPCRVEVDREKWKLETEYFLKKREHDAKVPENGLGEFFLSICGKVSLTLNISNEIRSPHSFCEKLAVSSCEEFLKNSYQF